MSAGCWTVSSQCLSHFGCIQQLTGQIGWTIGSYTGELLDTFHPYPVELIVRPHGRKISFT